MQSFSAAPEITFCTGPPASRWDIVLRLAHDGIGEDSGTSGEIAQGAVGEKGRFRHSVGRHCKLDEVAGRFAAEMKLRTLDALVGILWPS